MDIGNRWTRVLVDAEPRLDCRAKWLCVGSRLKLHLCLVAPRAASEFGLAARREGLRTGSTCSPVSSRSTT